MVPLSDTPARPAGAVASRPGWSALLAGLLIIGLLSRFVPPARAQAEIEQVEAGASQFKSFAQRPGATELSGALCIAPGASCGTVNRSDVTGLVPEGTPPLPGNTSGNSAVIAQRGSDQDATVEQTGVGNEASITQMYGSGNEAAVEQGPGGGRPGKNNLAVVVQNGSMNQTRIRQLGQTNRAGIRLVGNSNEVALEQTGTGNEYLLDFQGRGLGGAGRSSAHQVRQIGSNNRLVQRGEGRVPLNVRQRGNGMHMVVRHDRN